MFLKLKSVMVFLKIALIQGKKIKLITVFLVIIVSKITSISNYSFGPKNKNVPIARKENWIFVLINYGIERVRIF